MPGAMVEVATVAPQELPRQGVELRAGGAVGKDGAGNSNMPLENQRETLAHVLAQIGVGRADRDSAGDIGRAVLVLAAGIDQEQFAGADPPVALASDAVMHDGAVRPGAGDGRKRNILEKPGVAAKALQRLDRVDFSQFPARRFAVEPGEKARHGGAIANLRGARAGDLGSVLYRLHRRDRIAAAHDLAAALGEKARDRVGAQGRIEHHRKSRFAERGKIALEIRRRA